MPVRHFLAALLLLLVSIPAAAQLATDPKSVWWYPLGDLEGTRRNITPSLPQSMADLVVKWRTPLLANSPVILVGGIQTLSGDSVQQVVGTLENNTVAIVSHTGLLRTKVAYSTYFESPFTLTLTGLFYDQAPSPRPSARPNIIGIGVERRQPSGNVRLSGVLAASNGIPETFLTIDSLANGNDPGNQTAGVYPIAAYRRGTQTSALAVVSQNAYHSGAPDSMLNGVRSYVFRKGSISAQSQWNYPVAPRTYAQHPALTYDRDTAYVAISTRSYDLIPPVTVRPATSRPVYGVPTRSDSMYSIHLAAPPDTPSNVSTWRMPPTGTPDGQHGEVHSYFVTLYKAPLDQGSYYRLLTENHSPEQPGTARLVLTSAFQASEETFGSFTDSRMVNMGWTIAAADVDKGHGSIRNPNKYPNNTGDEIIGAWRDPAGGDLATNWLYIFRRNEQTPVGGQAFGWFARQIFSGRLMAAGDLVGTSAPNTQGQAEIVIAHGDTVHILQLLDYDDPALLDIGDESKQRFFRTLRTFPLDARVVSVAIADLEGDGYNDLVVNTLNSTYAIGLRAPIPFGDIRTDSANYCRGREMKIWWNRRIGGGERGVRVTLIDPDGKEVFRREDYLKYANRDLLNIGVGIDTLTLGTDQILPGTYRVVVQDPLVPSLADTSGEFTVNLTQINSFKVDTGSQLDFGTPITISAQLDCSQGVWLASSVDGVTWDTLKEVGVQAIGDSVVALTSIPCPDAPCGTADTVKLFYRFVDTNRYGESAVGEVTIAPRRHLLGRESIGTDSRRTGVITWGPGDFACTDMRMQLVDSASGQIIYNFPILPVPASGRYEYEIPDEISGKVFARICCADSPCEYGISEVLDVPPLPEGNFVAPNPLVLGRETGELGGAMIAFRLRSGGPVSITIYDASRALVVRLLQSETREAGGHTVIWNGRNSKGDIVASGTYICIVDHPDGQTVLPIIVTKH